MRAIAVSLLLLFSGMASAQQPPEFDAAAVRAQLGNDPDAGRSSALAFLAGDPDPLDPDYGDALRIISVSYGMQARYDEGLVYARRALENSQLRKDRLNVARNFQNIGNMYRLQGKIPEAIDAYDRSLAIARAEGFRKMLATSLINLSSFLVEQNMPAQALPLAEEVESFRDKNQDPVINLLLAEVYSAVGRHDRALASLDQINSSSPDLSDSELLLNKAYLRAEALLGKGELAEAETEVRRCLNDIMDVSKTRFEASCTHLAAEIALAQGQVAEGRRLAAKFEVFARAEEERDDATQLDRAIVAVERLMLEVPIAILEGRQDDALQLLKRKKAAEAQMDAIRQNFGMELVGARFRDQFRDARLSLLEKESDVMSLRADRQQALLIGGGAAGVLMTLLLVGALYTARERNRLNRSLSQLLDQQTVLARDIQHRAKNNLQLLISTLNLQRRHKGDNASGSKALADQMQAMAMLHDLLYAGGGEATEVDTAAYLVPLVEVLAQSHRAESQIAELDIVSVTIDTATASPLGLIVTELLSNAFKHAPGSDIRVTLTEVGKTRFKLTVTDSGPGFDPSPVKARGTLGLTLIEDLSQQMRGELT
ncbi:MAG: tetratricopeptide repeat protein, partial [Pseudomonadota bacterium]